MEEAAANSVASMDPSRLVSMPSKCCRCAKPSRCCPFASTVLCENGLISLRLKRPSTFWSSVSNSSACCAATACRIKSADDGILSADAAGPSARRRAQRAAAPPTGEGVAAPSEAPSRAVCRASHACNPPQQIPGSRAGPRPASVVCALAGQSPCSYFACVGLVLSFALSACRSRIALG